MKGVFAFSWKPWKWRFGIEYTVSDKKIWKWIVLGPIAINLGKDA